MTQPEAKKTALGTGARGDLAHPERVATAEIDATPPVEQVSSTAPEDTPTPV